MTGLKLSTLQYMALVMFHFKKSLKDALMSSWLIQSLGLSFKWFKSVKLKTRLIKLDQKEEVIISFLVNTCTWIKIQGPVVQTLTKSLANMMLKFLSWNTADTLIFCWKNVSCKSYWQFYSNNINIFENTLATIVKKFAINELVKLKWCFE